MLIKFSVCSFRKELQRESKRLQRELREARKSKQNDEKQEEKKGDDDVKDGITVLSLEPSRVSCKLKNRIILLYFY